MEYRIVGNRCAVNLSLMHLPISDENALDILFKKGFKALEVDLIEIARQCVRTSLYRRGAKPSEAPQVVDCSSLIKWLYGKRGIWLPRRSIQQRDQGEPVPFDQIVAGDIIFTLGWINYYHDDPSDGVGHVGIATGSGTVVHAANQKNNVIESPIESFMGKTNIRGIRRYIPKDEKVITLEVPTSLEVETADDIKWIILQSLPTG